MDDNSNTPQNNIKLMIVDKKLVEEIERLSVKMKTNTTDVIVAALELLKMTLGREVVIKDLKSDKVIRLPIFKSIDPETEVDEKDE